MIKLFIKDILTTLLIGSAIAVVALPFVKPLATNEYTYKRNYVENHTADIAVLLVGHSQFVSGVNPAVFDSAFNMAISARISHYDAQLLQRYVPQMPNLKAVIFPLLCEYEAGAIFCNDEARYEKIFQYKSFLDIDPPQELKGLLRSIKYMHTYLEHMLSFQALHAYENWDSLGFISLGNAYSERRNVTTAPGCEPMVKASLLRMAKVCGEHGVRLIVVTCPCNSTYRADHGDCDSRLQRLMDEVAAEWPTVEYRCYLNDDRFPDTLFSDQTHLNRPGATAFALRLKEDFGL
ncbi:MAG: hypothetical protein J6I49_09390 [Bacteroidales bacterium]|nr:hypothetical protein [Bacteroidales bacterium]